jgi:hypothetical protein
MAQFLEPRGTAELIHDTIRNWRACHPPQSLQ